jgi:hypothetical protein
MTRDARRQVVDPDPARTWKARNAFEAMCAAECREICAHESCEQRGVICRGSITAAITSQYPRPRRQVRFTAMFVQQSRQLGAGARFPLRAVDSDEPSS